MSKKIVVVNASPRKGWNTDTLVSEAAALARFAVPEHRKKRFALGAAMEREE